VAPVISAQPEGTEFVGVATGELHLYHCGELIVAEGLEFHVPGVAVRVSEFA
jgi:hypothetical protein